MPRKQAAPQAAPSAETLHAAAAAYLERYGATRATLARMLHRRIERWARAQPPGEVVAEAAAAAKRAVGAVVERLVAAGAVDDARFAEMRARRLARSGHSRRATQAHLAARGVPAELLAGALPAQASELHAAVAYVRRRRIGPFRAAETADAVTGQRELAALARAGFGREVAQRALTMSREDAEAALLELRRP